MGDEWKNKWALSPLFPFSHSSHSSSRRVVLVCVALAIAALGGFGLKRAGIGIDHSMFPEGAAQFLADNKLDGNLFNSYDYGNYLLFARYPQNHVFIDGRVDVYGAEGLRLYTAVRHAEPGWQKILAEHSVEICVLATEKSTEFRLLTALHRSPDWALVYWDDLSAIYVEARAGPAGVPQPRARLLGPAGRFRPGRPRVAGAPRARGAGLPRRARSEDPNCALAAYSLAGASSSAVSAPRRWRCSKRPSRSIRRTPRSDAHARR